MSYNSTSNITSTLPTLQDNAATVTIIVLLGSIIVFINGLILTAFIADKKLRQRPANLIICSQTCSDLYTGTVFIPVYIIEIYIVSKQVLLGYVLGYMMYLSMFNLLALSADRYLAISFPIFHRKMIDTHRTSRIIAVIWFIPLLLTIIPLFYASQGPKYKEKAYTIYNGCGALLLLLLVMVMTVLYVFIASKARRTIRHKRESLKEKSRKADLHRKELRVVHLFGLLLFFFIVAYLPMIYINVCIFIGFPRNVCAKWPPHVTIYLYMINSITNPVSCMLLKKDYFEAIKRIMGIKQRPMERFGVDSPTLQESISDSGFSSVHGRAARELLSEPMSLKRTVLKSNMLSPGQRRISTKYNDMSTSLL